MRVPVSFLERSGISTTHVAWGHSVVGASRAYLRRWYHRIVCIGCSSSQRRKSRAFVPARPPAPRPLLVGDRNRPLLLLDQRTVFISALSISQPKPTPTPAEALVLRPFEVRDALGNLGRLPDGVPGVGVPAAATSRVRGLRMLRQPSQLHVGKASASVVACRGE